jgi:dipeptidyl aminopeptidase/acylaminoacyl peptidase
MMTTPITPSDIYVINIGKDKDNDNNAQKITHSLLGNIPENILIRPDLIRYKSFDGLEISAFLYKPKEEIVNNKPQKFGAILSIDKQKLLHGVADCVFSELYRIENT